MRLLFKLLMRIGLISSGPAVSSITSSTQIEGTSLVHTVTLASAVAVTEGLYPFSIGGGTATSGTDYTATPTFSAGVTRSGGTLTVPVGVSSFTITVSTTNDTVYEGTETYTVSVGSMSNTGTLTDNDSAPTVTGVSSASATEASSIVHTVTVTGTAQAAQTYAISLSGGTATGGGTDYTSTLTNGAFSAGVTISGGNISVPSGVTSFTVTVPTTSDVLEEGNETYTLTIGGASGTGTIVDDDAPSPAFTVTMTALSNASGVVTTLAYINGGGGGGGDFITPATLSVAAGTVSRISGVAPLAVHFTADGTTSTGTSKPFHEIEYQWDFGDSGAGTWGEGPRAAAGPSKNVHTGPVAAHVFETPGTYIVSMTSADGVHSGALRQVTITVDDPDTVFASDTICFSTDGDFTGAPAGATQVTTSNHATAISTYIGSKKRLLFKRGQVFTSTTAPAVNVQGPGIIGAFGIGPNPIWRRGSAAYTNMNIGTTLGSGGAVVSDWRVIDIKIDGQLATDNNNIGVSATQSIANLLFLRCELIGLYRGFSFSPWVISGTTKVAHDCVALHDCISTAVPGSLGSYGTDWRAYFAGSRLSIQGCYMDNYNDGGSHVVRSEFLQKSIISNNRISRAGAGHHLIKLHAPEFSGSSFSWLVGVYSEKNHISDNRCIGDVTAWLLSIGPQNNIKDERVRNIVIERNHLTVGAGFRIAMLLNVTSTTVRNNIINTSGSDVYLSVFDVTVRGVEPPPDDVHIYNNTIFSSTSGSELVIVTVGVGVTNTVIKNNLAYYPGSWPGGVFVKDLGINTAQDGNSSNVQMLTTNPLFVSSPPSATDDYAVMPGSYAKDSGVLIPVVSDFNLAAITGTRDMGAIQA